MQFSAFKGPFEERIEAWNHKLFIIGEVLDKWLEVRSRRFEVLRCLHFTDATRIMVWVVSFSRLSLWKASGPRWRLHETP